MNLKSIVYNSGQYNVCNRRFYVIELHTFRSEARNNHHYTTAATNVYNGNSCI